MMEDLKEIQQEIDQATTLVLQNATFDERMLRALFQQFEFPGGLRWEWGKVKDLMIASHLLNSRALKNLTEQASRFLRRDIKPYEDDLDNAVKEARRICRLKKFIEQYGRIRWADEELPEMPSAKEKLYKNDFWLPREIAKLCEYPYDHPWWTVLSDYADEDPVVTLAIHQRQQAIIQERGLTKIYEERCKLVRMSADLQRTGITVIGKNIDKLQQQFIEESTKSGEVCYGIAGKRGYDLKLPKNGMNDSLKEFLVGPIEEGLQLPIIKLTDKGGPSLDKNVMEHFLLTLPEGSDQHTFISNLSGKRRRDTAISYMNGYRRFWIEIRPGFYILHPSVNPTSTTTLRWSSSNPNEQNISKKEGFNLRYGFGPAPGREWWSCDAQNIELRIPAYESGEEAMVALFEQPNEPPFYGSNHLLIFSVLHEEVWNNHLKEVGIKNVGPYCKKTYASTLYQRVKNGNFAVQYGAVDNEDIEVMGTADKAYGIKGAQKLIEQRFTKQAQLNKWCIATAQANGYIETIPDKSIDPDHGYPLVCPFKFGKVQPTIPLNYRVQGTAMWWTNRAMVRCQEFLDHYNRSKGYPPDHYRITLQVHDEIVFDFPKKQGNLLRPWEGNLPVIRELKRLMELGGEGIGVPTPASCEYHSHTWSKGVSVAV
jgi:DNA polymerase I-like protein with 3'-5' exonuclease and polymerase domains